MGFRTVVVLSNDRASEWKKDPELGRKIFLAASAKSFGGDPDRHYFPYGEIVEQVHADRQTLAVLDGYGGRPVAQTFWHRGQTVEQQELALLRDLADKHGLTLRKKPAKKA